MIGRRLRPFVTPITRRGRTRNSGPRNSCGRPWFQAAWYLTNQKHGVSALGLQRVLGLRSYQTAWTWLHKFRRTMVRPDRDRLSGEVEVDETFFGRPR